MEDIFGAFGDLQKAAEILDNIAPITNKLSTASFLSLVSMLLEEHCKANELDILETVDKVQTAVKGVNAMFGAY